MNDIIRNIEAAQLKAEVPEFRVGDTVRVHALIKEGNRERIQIFEGTVLKRQCGSYGKELFDRGSHSHFRLQSEKMHEMRQMHRDLYYK